MFTLDQINEIHQRFGKQATLPEYLWSLKAIGIDKCDSFVADGHSEYFGINNQRVVSPPVHEKFSIASRSSREDLLTHLSLHNQGKTGYLEMARGLADGGIEKWSFDTGEMTITYYDREGRVMLVEAIG